MSQKHIPDRGKNSTIGTDGGTFVTPRRGGASQAVGEIAKQIQRDLMHRGKPPENLDTLERQN